jgi:hypothetical protein
MYIHEYNRNHSDGGGHRDKTSGRGRGWWGGARGREDTLANSKQLLALLLHCQRRFVASQWSHGQRCLFYIYIHTYVIMMFCFLYAIDL